MVIIFESLEEVGVKSTHEQVELVEFRQRAIGAQSSLLREVVTDTNGDATEYTTQPEQSSAQQATAKQLVINTAFSFSYMVKATREFHGNKAGRRVQFLA